MHGLPLVRFQNLLQYTCLWSVLHLVHMYFDISVYLYRKVSLIRCVDPTPSGLGKPSPND